MTWIQVDSLAVNINSSGFWTAVDIWNRIPHVLNRRICGVEMLYHEDFHNDLDGTKLKATINEFINSCLSTNIWNEEYIFKILKNVGFCFPYLNTDKMANGELILRRLLPKNNKYYKSCLELEILEHEADVATYVALFYSECEPVLTPHIPYRLAIVKSDVIEEASFMELSVYRMEVIEGLESSKSQPMIEKSVEWLRSNLLPKFCKWAETPSSASMGSLKLVPVDQYNALYFSLKTKYAPNLIKLWPESTDPKKFIHEDLGIAAYLLLLWKQERKNSKIERLQTFVDIGCGNGLLVYILTEEGHPGLGVDVRSRQIWDLYPTTTKLKVCTINPLQEIPFPAADWLIGNHSDELTPWIPVMAAMNPYSRFFVLPCCPFDFYGRYGRRNPKRSVYQEYLEFIQKDVCENVCKFKCQLDRLRIPSTKRICIVGSGRNQEKTEVSSVCVPPSTFLEINLCYKIPNIAHSLDMEKHHSFVPRSITEKVRNCTQLEAGVIAEVVSLVAAELLSEVKEGHKKDGQWNAGKKVPLEMLANLIPAHLLLKLKKESGGLQTLLKNNHFIFKVTGGMVEFRKPMVRDDQNKNFINTKSKLNRKRGGKIWKLRPCWFHQHHPDGCPLADAQCSYIHAL